MSHSAFSPCNSTVQSGKHADDKLVGGSGSELFTFCASSLHEQSVKYKMDERLILAIQSFPFLSTEQAFNNLTDRPCRISLHVSHFKKGQRSCKAAELQPCSCLGQGRLGVKEKEAFEVKPERHVASYLLKVC